MEMPKQMSVDEAVRWLLDRREIEDILVRYCRSADRQDIASLRESFHPDAMVEMGYYAGPADGFCDRFQALGSQVPAPIARVQHQVSNIHCDLAGEVAKVESYMRVCRRRVAGEAAFDELLASRCLDRFERRDGRWGIVVRRVVWDWAMSVPATPAFWESLDGFLVGERGSADPANDLFPVRHHDPVAASPKEWAPHP